MDVLQSDATAPHAPPTAARGLAAWATTLRLEDVPDSARQAVCRHLLDGLGCALGAVRSGIAAPALAVAAGLQGPPEALPLHGGRRLGAPAAALANGVLVHALDFDDTHAAGFVHATAVVLPVAFAVGQEVGATGSEVLTAAVVGYETICRIGAAAPYGFHARGLHATSVCGPLAGAAVAARLMGLDEATTVNALGIAGSSSGGLMEFLATGASTKALHPGMAAMAGVIAARLAAAGAEGPPTVLEGERGIYGALSARPAEASAVTSGLGERWEVGRIAIKPYPSCRLTHAALDAAKLLREQVDTEDVCDMVIQVHPDAAAYVGWPDEERRRPRTVYDAKFSLPWSVAALLLDGEVTVDTYSPDMLERADIAALAGRARTTALASPLGAADAPARIVARLRDGSVRQAAVPGRVAGAPDPLSTSDVRAKFLANAGADADALADLVLELRSQPSLDAISEAAAAVAESRMCPVESSEVV
jgi:2-methylcitrate dehydratase PrpD